MADFLRLAAHELRGPLNTISGWMQILERDPAVRERAVASIQRGVRLQTRLIEETHATGRLLGGAPIEIERVDAAALAAEVVALIRSVSEPRSIDVRSEIAAGAVLTSSAAVLRSLLWWLLYSTVQLAPGGDRVTLESSGGGLAIRSRAPASRPSSAPESATWVARQLASLVGARIEQPPPLADESRLIIVTPG